MELVPPGVVTVISTVAAECAGEVAWIRVPLLDRMVPAVPPKLTAVAPVNPVPLMVTELPPAVVPLVGETEVIVGACVTVIGTR